MRAKLRELWGQSLRFGFRLLYQELAWSYDAVSWLVSFGAWQDWQRSALPFIRGPHVLEIGHGPGHMLLALQKAGYQVTGIDLSPQMGAISRSRLRKAGVSAPLLRGMAQNLPFPAQAFDSVLATFPTEFIVDQETLTAVHRVLHNNGSFIIVPQARFSGSSLIERFVECLYLITGQRQEHREIQGTNSQVAKNSLWDQMRDHFEKSGFKIEIATVLFKRSQATVIIAEKWMN